MHQGHDNQEPGFALSRELEDEARVRGASDRRLGRRANRHHKRISVLEASAPGIALSLKVLAFFSGVQALTLILMLTRQWPDLWPGIIKAFAKLFGGLA